jgi:leucine dehydrogenase
VAEEYGASLVSIDDIYDVECDIFSPCALGAVLNDETIPRLRCSIVAGAANNQLAEDRHGEALAGRGILYAPDYVVNAGGIINLYLEIIGYDPDAAHEKLAEAYYTMERVIEKAKSEKIPTSRAADRLAEERINSVRRMKKLYFE